jgi:hypothetical protein
MKLDELPLQEQQRELRVSMQITVNHSFDFRGNQLDAAIVS